MNLINMHEKLLSLVGKSVKVSRWSQPTEQVGQLVYVMPDSLLISDSGKNTVIAFSDVKTLALQD